MASGPEKQVPVHAGQPQVGDGRPDVMFGRGRAGQGRGTSRRYRSHRRTGDDMGKRAGHGGFVGRFSSISHPQPD